MKRSIPSSSRQHNRLKLIDFQNNPASHPNATPDQLLGQVLGNCHDEAPEDPPSRVRRSIPIMFRL